MLNVYTKRDILDIFGLKYDDLLTLLSTKQVRNLFIKFPAKINGIPIQLDVLPETNFNILRAIIVNRSF